MIAKETLGVGPASTRVWPQDRRALCGESRVRVDELGRELAVWWRAYVYKGSYFMEMTMPLYGKNSYAQNLETTDDPALQLVFQRALRRCALALSNLELAAAARPKETQPKIDAFLFDHLVLEQRLNVAMTASALSAPRPILTLAHPVPEMSAFIQADPTDQVMDRVALAILRLAETRADFRMTEVLQWIASLRDATTDNELVHMALVKAWLSHPSGRLMLTDLLPALQMTLSRRCEDVWRCMHYSKMQTMPLWIPEDYYEDRELVDSLTNLEFVLRTYYALTMSTSSLWQNLIGPGKNGIELGKLELRDAAVGDDMASATHVHDGLNRIVGSRLGVSDAIYVRMANVLDRWVCCASHHPVLIPAGFPYYALTPRIASFIKWGMWSDPEGSNNDFLAFVYQGFGTSLYEMTRHVAQIVPRLRTVAQARAWIDHERGLLHPLLVNYVRRNVTVCAQLRPELFLAKVNLSRRALLFNIGDRYEISSHGLKLDVAPSYAMRRSEKLAQTPPSDVEWACQWAACFPYLPAADHQEYRRLLANLEGLDKWKAVALRALDQIAREGRVRTVLEYMFLQTTSHSVFASNPAWDGLFQGSQRCTMINVPTQHQMDWITKAILFKSRDLTPFPATVAVRSLPSHEAMVRFAAVVAWDRVTLKHSLPLEAIGSDIHAWAHAWIKAGATVPPSMLLLCNAVSASRPLWMANLKHTVYTVERIDMPFQAKQISEGVMAFQHLMTAMSWVEHLNDINYIIVRYQMQGNAWMALDAIDVLSETTRRSMGGELCIPHAMRATAERTFVTGDLMLQNPNCSEMKLTLPVIFPATEDMTGSLWKGGATMGWLDTETMRQARLFDGGILDAVYL